jgi:hypothetical protein
MQRLQLYIEDNEGNYPLVDLFDDETVSLTSTIKDVKDIGKVFTDYSQTFTVPASDTNNKIFRHYYNYYITGNAFDSRKKKQALIHINQAPFKKGKVRLTSVKMKNNKPYAYELIFYGNTVSLQDLMGDDQLIDLDYLSNFNHEYTKEQVKSGLTSGIDFSINGETYQNAIIYPLITSKKRLFYHSGSIPSGDNTSGNVYHNSASPDTSRGLEYTDLKPAIKLIHIFEAIEDKYRVDNGYPLDIVFTRDFLSSPAISNLYFWINGVSGEFNDQENITDSLFKFDCTNYTFDVSSDDIPEASFSEGIVEITKTGAAPSYSIRVETTPADDQPIFTISFTEVDSSGTPIPDGEYYEITKGEYVSGAAPEGIEAISTSEPDGTVKRFKLEYTSKTNLIIDSTVEILKASNGSNIDFIERYDKTNQELSFSVDIISESLEIMPSMDILDFISGIFKMFNLVAYFIDDLSDKENNGKIYIDTLDNFYLDSVNNPIGSVIDITKYVDSSDHTVESILAYTDIDFKYQETDVILMENHLDQFGEVFGNTEFAIKDLLYKNENINIDKGSKYEIQLPFSHFKYERLIDLNSSPAGTTNETSIQWGYCAGGNFSYNPADNGKPATGDYDTTSIAPLLFYAISEDNSVDKKINWISSSPPEGISTYWRPSNSSDDGTPTTPPTYSLNFDQEFDEWQAVNYEDNTNSLFNVYYKKYIESVFNPAKRLFKITAYLPTNIIINYRLNDQIKIHDKIFRINSITTNLNTGKSELELLNIFTDEIVE